MFAFFIISFFILGRSRSVPRGGQLQSAAADARGLIPLGKIRSVCLNKQPNPRHEKKQGSLPRAWLPSVFPPCHPQAFSPGPGGCFRCWSRGMGGTCSVPAQLRCRPRCRAALAGAEPSHLLPQHLHQALCFCAPRAGGPGWVLRNSPLRL